jgi:membrane fusion protein, multidrug efflux system
MSKIRSAFLFLAFSSLLFTACGEASKPVAPAQRVTPAQTFVAQYQPVASVVEAPGSVQARNRIVLSAQVNGFVQTVTVRAGDSVSAGQTLAVLDSREAQSQKDMAAAAGEEAQAAFEEAGKAVRMTAEMRNAAKSAHALAETTFQRFQKLYDEKSVSPQELDEARARRDGAVADLAAKESMLAAAQDRVKQVQARIAQAGAQSRRADVMVGYSLIKAPAAGRVAERAVDAGSAIFPGSPLLVLETVAAPQVLAELPTAQLGLIKAGLEVQVRISDSTAALPGRIAEIIPLSNPGSHTVQFKVDLPTGTPATTGAYARVLVAAGTRNALLVPSKALRVTGQLTGLFVVDAGSKARFRLVKTVPYDAEKTELISGVEAGEKVVSPVAEDLADGSALEVRS